jgi:hypothetical protein
LSGLCARGHRRADDLDQCLSLEKCELAVA